MSDADLHMFDEAEWRRCLDEDARQQSQKRMGAVGKRLARIKRASDELQKLLGLDEHELRELIRRLGA